jgi:hypothetical protein
MSEEIAAATHDLAYWHQRAKQAEDAYDRLEGAFDLYQEIAICRHVASEYTGLVYDVLLADLAARMEEAKDRAHDLANQVMHERGLRLLAEEDAAAWKTRAEQAEAMLRTTLAALEQAEADYSMLRAVARRCFAEDTSDQDMLNLWNIAATVDHPGAALNIRFNRMKVELEAARAFIEMQRCWRDAGDEVTGSFDDMLDKYDAVRMK